MRKIKECRISLMEKGENFSIEDGKGNYILRTTGTFEPEKYLKDFAFEGKHLKEKEYKDFVANAIMMIYDSIIDSGDHKGALDTVGLWVVFEDDETIDNAMDISLLESMEKYGEDGTIPILEFAKMTLQPYYEGETS